jgi:hypothetical protein
LLIIAAAIVALIVFAVRKASSAIKGHDTYDAPAYKHLDRTAGTTPDDIVNVMKRYVHADAVDTRARTTITEVENATRKRDGIVNLLSGKFAEGSMTWDRFVVATDSAYQTVLDNCVLLANRIQTFDVQDYRMLARSRGASFKKDAIPDDLQEERWLTLNDALSEMDDIITANEKLLLELDRFSAEIGQLNQLGTDERTAEMLEEIKNLTEEAKLYR